jgi:hypothetical protein
MHSTDKAWRRAVRSERRLIIRLGAIVALTAVLLTAFFSYVFFELYGESELCRQKYDLPPLSFYVAHLDCFIAGGELAAKIGHVSLVAAGPLLLALMTIVWVDWPRRGSGPGGQRLEPQEEGGAEPVDVVALVQLLFWILTVSLGIALGVGLSLGTVGLLSASPDQAIGAVMLYAFHLYPAGLLAFAVVHTAGWLWQAATAALHLLR